MLTDESLTFTIVRNTRSQTLDWFAKGLKRVLVAHGHNYGHFVPGRDGALSVDESSDDHVSGAMVEKGTLQTSGPIRFVINLVDFDNPRPFYRRGQVTFVATVIESDNCDIPIIKIAYPFLVRTLANLVVLLCRSKGYLESHFITLEQGHYTIHYQGDDYTFFNRVYNRICPLASSRLVINNWFYPDLPEALWNGDAATEQLIRLGNKPSALGLLPAPFPVHEYLSDRDMRHVKHLFGLGGLSYGNMSVRAVHDPSKFWISASGVDKGNLRTIGRDILLVKGFDPEQPAILLSVPPNVEPRHASVDTIEHVMIYQEHPSVARSNPCDSDELPLRDYRTGNRGS